MKPIARKEQLVTEVLGDETLVYDQTNHRAHCLNSAAAAVWKYCDGATETDEIVGRIQTELGMSVDQPVIQMALNQLRKAHLLEADSVDLLPTRREAVRNVAIGAALATPLVVSIVVPTPAQAQSRATTNPGKGGGHGHGNGRGNGHGKGRGNGLQRQ